MGSPYKYNIWYFMEDIIQILLDFYDDLSYEEAEYLAYLYFRETVSDNGMV